MDLRPDRDAAVHDQRLQGQASPVVGHGPFHLVRELPGRGEDEHSGDVGLVEVAEVAAVAGDQDFASTGHGGREDRGVLVGERRCRRLIHQELGDVMQKSFFSHVPIIRHAPTSGCVSTTPSHGNSGT